MSDTEQIAWLEQALTSCQHARDDNGRHIEWLKERHRFEEIHRFHLARFCEHIRSHMGSVAMGNVACAMLDHIDNARAAIDCTFQRPGVERIYKALTEAPAGLGTDCTQSPEVLALLRGETTGREDGDV